MVAVTSTPREHYVIDFPMLIRRSRESVTALGIVTWLPMSTSVLCFRKRVHRAYGGDNADWGYCTSCLYYDIIIVRQSLPKATPFNTHV